ncbi:MAG TPA: response regulator [Paludibaculum sp.]|jgi:two-component system chemotaxis response regulator CheY
MSKCLMIVDDSPVMRLFVKRTLLAAGLPFDTCLEAANGVDALEKLRAFSLVGSIDLILTDINMPVMDGEGLLFELKRDVALATIPVVVVSTDSTDQRVGTLMKLGASDYVRKPFPPERLSQVLSGIFPGWSGQ